MSVALTSQMFLMNLLDMLQDMDLDGMRIIRNLYCEQKAATRVDWEFSKFRESRRGVRQGCVFLPDLFNLYSGNIIREIGNIRDVINQKAMFLVSETRDNKNSTTAIPTTVPPLNTCCI